MTTGHLFKYCKQPKRIEAGNTSQCEVVKVSDCSTSNEKKSEAELLFIDSRPEFDAAYIRMKKHLRRNDKKPYINEVLNRPEREPVFGNVAWRFTDREHNCKPTPIRNNSFVSAFPYGGRIFENSSMFDRIKLGHIKGEPGHSGSPIVTQNGLVGMYTGTFDNKHRFFATGIYRLKDYEYLELSLIHI